MFNLYQMVKDAQGGTGLDNLARQFGLSREQADAAVQALMPSLSTAFMTKAAQPGGMGDIATALEDDHHKRSFADAAAADAPQTQQKGGDVATSIFGDDALVGQVLKQAAQYTGIPEATLQRMLPTVISMVLGGVATALQNQGLGGMIGQLAKGGLGNILSQFGGGQGTPGQVGTAGFGGMLGNILGSFLGTGHPANPQEPVPQNQAGAPSHPPAGHSAAGSTPADSMPADSAPAEPTQPGTTLPPIAQATLDALGRMFEPGVAGSAAEPADLGAEIGASHAAKR